MNMHPSCPAHVCIIIISYISTALQSSIVTEKQQFNIMQHTKHYSIHNVCLCSKQQINKFISVAISAHGVTLLPTNTTLASTTSVTTPLQ